MPFKKGESGNPAGKRPGANRTQVLRRALLDEAPTILGALVQQAKLGDVAASRVILDRVLPALKPEARAVAVPAADTTASQADAVVARALDGTMPVEQAAELMGVLIARARLVEMTDLFRRLDALEAEIVVLKQQRAAPAFDPSQTPF